MKSLKRELLVSSSLLFQYLESFIMAFWAKRLGSNRATSFLQSHFGNTRSNVGTRVNVSSVEKPVAAKPEHIVTFCQFHPSAFCESVTCLTNSSLTCGGKICCSLLYIISIRTESFGRAWLFVCCEPEHSRSSCWINMLRLSEQSKTMQQSQISTEEPWSSGSLWCFGVLWCMR